MATTTHPAIPTPTASSADHPLSAPLAPPGHRMEGPPPGGGSGLPPAPPHPAEPVHTPPRTRRTRLWIGIAAAVLLLLAAVAAVLVFYRPSFEVTAIEAPADVVAGEDVILTVEANNSGLRGGALELTVLLNGRPAESSAIELDAGEQGRLGITLEDLPAGTHRLALADWDGLSASVWVMTPAEIVVDTLVVEPTAIDVLTQTEVGVVVGLSNIGEAPGTYDLSLLLDGEPADTRTVDLEGDAYLEESFTLTVTTPGDHAVSVGDLTQSFRANSLVRPENGDQLVNAISGGSNRLRIVNNGERDLLLVLAASGENAEALLSVYVRADSETTVTGLRNGTYVTYYMRGNAWCSHFEEFTQDQSAGRFEEEAVFAATKTSYTIYTVEMSVSGQGSPTEMVDPDDMPS